MRVRRARRRPNTEDQIGPKEIASAGMVRLRTQMGGIGSLIKE
jgi:hypothetical protein